MKLITKEEKEKFEEACKPLMKYLAENYHPPIYVSVNQSSAEIFEGQMMIKNDEFVLLKELGE